MKTRTKRLFGSNVLANDADSYAVIEKGAARGSGGLDADGQPTRSTSTQILLDRNDDGSEKLDISDRVVQHLLREKKITYSVAREAVKNWQRNGEEDVLWRVVAQHPKAEHELVFETAAKIYAFRRATIANASLYDFEFANRLLESFSEEQREEFIRFRLLPLTYEFDRDRNVLKLVLATNDPTHAELLRYVHELQLDHFEIQYAPVRELDPLLDVLFPKRNEFLERMRKDAGADAFDLGASFEDKGQELVDQEALDAEINRSALINLFEAALIESVRQGASDIHVYPNARKHTEFHFRIDGELQLWKTQKKVSPEAMIAVVKDRCGNIDRFEREAAQDGYIQRTIDDTLIRYRVSVLPIASSNRDIKAESIVIRVLDDRNVFSDLGAIGLLEGALDRYKRAISKPNGMVIMTGPTGSGKSTTLVAALHQVIRPQINVLTVEDPVEYVIQNVRQIKLGSRLGLEGALRAILRHDPDVVMVGEMRDKQTAELAIKLANTGHLTFSTLHTNDAASAVSRLYKMGIEPFLIAYAINLIVAQRLLRKLCSECKIEDDDPDPVLLGELGFSESDVSETKLFKPNFDTGCTVCRGVGYKGRRAIGEALYFTREIRHAIVSSGETVDEDKIKGIAVEQGMLTLLASAREVVKLGDTSIDEVIRVTASEE